jgi:DNA-binding PadR family transcriptional regulator
MTDSEEPMTGPEDDVQDQLPLKPVDLLVLMTLSRGTRHGYGIVTDIADQTEGRIRLVPGNLYAVLQRLEGIGLLTESARRPAPDLDDRRRRYYAITPFGRRVLAAEAERLRRLVGQAEALDII